MLKGSHKNFDVFGGAAGAASMSVEAQDMK